MSSGSPDWLMPVVPVIVNVPEGEAPVINVSDTPVSQIWGWDIDLAKWIEIKVDEDGKLVTSGTVTPESQIYGWDTDASAWVKVLVNSAGKLVTTDGGGGVKLQDNHLFVDAVVFDSTAEAYTSESFDCSDYSNMLLLVNHAVTLTPTDIVIKIQFSFDNVTFYDYICAFWGDLRYATAQGNLKESMNCKVLAPYVRLYLLSAGCTATKYFTETINAIFNT